MECVYCLLPTIKLIIIWDRGGLLLCNNARIVLPKRFPISYFIYFWGKTCKKSFRWKIQLSGDFFHKFDWQLRTGRFLGFGCLIVLNSINNFSKGIWVICPEWVVVQCDTVEILQTHQDEWQIWLNQTITWFGHIFHW